MKPLVLTQDALGRDVVGVRFPDFVEYFALVAGTGATLALPDNARHVLFTSNDNFFVKYTSDVMTSSVYNATSVSSAGVCSGGRAELNPTLRTIKGADNVAISGLSLIAPAGASLTISFFS